METKPEMVGSGVSGDFYSKINDGVIAPLDTYKGLPILAIPGLHQRAADLLSGNGIKGDGTAALDLASGSGAMSLRLKDLGFQVTAVDYFGSENPVAQFGIPYVHCDLNTEFSNAVARRFELVVAIEIIEHLENPRHFLRQCCRLLNSGGFLLLTTPNIDSSKSKADFVRFSTFNMFQDVSYRSIGHITPLSNWQLYKIIEECAIEVIVHETFGEDRYRFRSWPSMYALQRLIHRFGHRQPGGDGACHVLLLRLPAIPVA